MRKLKSIKQLLEEFPDAEFTKCGDLHLPNSPLTIYSSMLIYLGKDSSSEGFNNWCFDEQWFEPVKEKKLYAYMPLKTKQIIYYLDASANLDRYPEFDLTFKGEK